jgi:hypothetical protein
MAHSYQTKSQTRPVECLVRHSGRRVDMQPALSDNLWVALNYP